jgi:hypothetical protein
LVQVGGFCFLEMEITRAQFQTLAPAALPATVDALFVIDWRGADLLNRVMARHDFTDPAIACFIACASLASDGFTNFNRPFFGVRCGSWLVRAARLWKNYKLDESANEWDWGGVAECADTIFNMPTTAWLLVNDTLTAVCAALGVEEGFADEPEDHGASEM